MKKIVFTGIAALLMMACSSNQATPTGNGTADGKAFAKELLAAYQENDIDRMSDAVDAFYELDMGSDPNEIDDFERFQKMTRRADKDCKLDELYDKVMK